ncbi:MAG: hypothetical protein ACO3LE_03050 [Bdellovibrionota bacterium]
MALGLRLLAHMKTIMVSKEVLDEVLFEVLRVKMSSWPFVLGHEDRKKRRVAIWAYHFYLGVELSVLQQIFGIQSTQSLRKILAKKTLAEEEFNWRRFVMKKLEAKLTLYRPMHVAAA